MHSTIKLQYHLAWLAEDENLSVQYLDWHSSKEGGSEKAVCDYTTLLLKREYSCCLMEQGRRAVLHRPCLLGASFFEELLAVGKVYVNWRVL
jgi:hypothetical protein